ncbi:MAG: toast rack family protein [Chloroflexota bacterium]
MFRKFFLIALVLSLGLTACGFRVGIPGIQDAGPMMSDEIVLPMPGDVTETVDLSFMFSAGTLQLHPGSSALISGTASYNVAQLKPEVTVTAGRIQIAQGDWEIGDIPALSNIRNEWDFALGTVPFDLSIEAGAYEAEFEFGGLSIENLTIKDGASNVDLTFSDPNPIEMTLFRYETGASNVSLTGLANANFASMVFEGGAGNYTLDFSGDLRRHGTVTIEIGVSNMTLVIPDSIPAQITIEGGLSNVTHGSGWAKNGNTYTQEGSGPQLTIMIEMGAGNLTITR